MVQTLTPQEHKALAERIRAAEARTTGEIYCVVARISDDYTFPAAFMLALGVVLVSLPVALWLDRSWIHLSHLAFVAAQAAALASALLVVWLSPRLRIRFVPRPLRYRRAHANAVRQFLAHNIHLTENRTGILIFVSLTERYAEIVADSGINAHVDQAEWNEIVARITAAASASRLVEGLADAIDRTGALLSRSFPEGVKNPNELPDRVVEI